MENCEFPFRVFEVWRDLTNFVIQRFEKALSPIDVSSFLIDPVRRELDLV
jgi:hypothetical protein